MIFCMQWCKELSRGLCRMRVAEDIFSTNGVVTGAVVRVCSELMTGGNEQVQSEVA